MIVGYKGDATIDEQLKSLRDNVQLALNEHQMLIEHLEKSLGEALGIDVAALQRSISSFAEETQEITNALSESVSSLVQTVHDLDERVTALEQEGE